MNFLWISYEMKLNLFIWNSREVHMNFVWSSNKLLMNFIWNEIKFIHMNLYAVRMKFKWTSYRRTSEVNMLYPCNTNEVDMRFTNSSHEIHMKFIWISNDLNFMLTSCELHKNYMTSSLHYTWIWLLASLLCTSYEWASGSIVRISPDCEHQWQPHDDVITWRHFSRYWPFVRGIHRSPVNSPHEGQWRGALMFSSDLRLNKRLSKQS